MDIHLTHLIVQVEVLAIALHEVLVHQRAQVRQKVLAPQKARAKVQVVTLIRVQINQIPIAILINLVLLQNQVLSQSSLMQSMTKCKFSSSRYTTEVK